MPTTADNVHSSLRRNEARKLSIPLDEKKRLLRVFPDAAISENP
jgi:hypothetical protein